MKENVNILHFSDLHLGYPSTEYHFENMYDELYYDIKLTLQSEPFDPQSRIHLVVFTGDLTYSGSDDQFIKLSNILDKMWGFFNDELNSNPFLVCIPGNHDLKRPAEGTNEAISKGFCLEKLRELRD